MDARVDLAVIGGGSTGVSFLAQFLRLLEEAGQGPGTCRILLFESREHPGPGEPYGKDLSTNLLNIPAGKMSAYAEDRGHFFRWLQSAGEDLWRRHGVASIDAAAFLPRPLFGEYLQHVWNSLTARAAGIGVELEHVRAHVNGLCLADRGTEVVLDSDAGTFRSRRVVLCNGNLASTAFPQLEGRAGYYNSPYPASSLVDGVAKAASVGVVGTSLSAIDAIVALKESGHRGRILAVSRNGRLPSVRSAVAPADPVVPPTAQDIAVLTNGGRNELRLQQVFAFLGERLRACGGVIDLEDICGWQAGQEPADALAGEIVRSSSQARPWQDVAVSLNHVIEHVWRLLPDSERRQFHTRWRSLWMARRATFPLCNALKIQRYLQDGQLRIEGGFEDCLATSGSTGFEIHSRNGQGEQRVQPVDFVVNATSFSTNVATSSDPLVRSLLKNRLASADPYGGFRLEFDTGCLIGVDGKTIESVSVIGSLAGGTYFWTTSLDVNARLAQDQARQILGRMQAERDQSRAVA